MKSIAIDFKNNRLCIMKKGQQGTELCNLKKEDFYEFIPEKYRDKLSFTWDFENETFAVNQDYELVAGCIMTKDCFIPQVILPLSGLAKQYDKFIKIMNYEEVNLMDEMPDYLKEFLGLK